MFLNFWTSWCGPCKKLDQVTFTDDAVVAELKDVLCFAVDAESPDGARLARRFRPRGFPTLVFVEPDGSLRDRLTGYVEPEEFVAEVRRVKRNEGTFTALRRKIAEHPRDVEARYALARKLKASGFARDYEAQIEAILRLDPEGRSFPSRHIRLERLVGELKQDLQLGPLYAFLAEETHAELLWLGWVEVWQTEGHLAKTRPGRAAHHREKWLHAGRQLWPHVPAEYRARIGNNIAWYYYENRDALDAADLEFAVEVARTAVAAAPENAAIVDTLACCLFVTGREEEALRHVRRCIELEPRNPEWKQRFSEFKRALHKRD